MSEETGEAPRQRPRLAGRYELRGLLGQGGMADVVLAYDDQLDREVAVKILHARYADDPSFLARFRREAQAAANLTHPNIVGVYDAGDHDGRPFIVMEYVRGSSLSDRLAAGERLTVERALEVTGDAAIGLHYAHERGLVHRDIKPGNILVSDEGQVKVADFGIARAVDAENVTQTASVLGTAAYVAPEQAQGQEVDRRTDVYALGCVLYELLAGRAPFTADSAVALAYKHVSEHPAPPSELRPDLPPEVDAIVLKAMAKDPAQRYATARDLNADLQRVQAGMPVAAPLIGAWAATTQALGPATTAALPAEPVEEVYEDEPPAKRGLLVALGVIVLLALAALAALLLAGILGADAEELPVPDVVGMEVADAQAELRDEGFVPEIAEERIATDEVEENSVAETDPEAHELAEEGSTVVLFLSEGPELVEVPDLEGWHVDEAEVELVEEHELGLGPQEGEPHDDIEEDHVVRTEPEAGTEVEPGSAVTLVVSTGPDAVEVPDVTGESEDDARDMLAEACDDPDPCFPVDVEREHSGDVDEGDVISQSPSGGSEEAPGTRVTIVVSEGVADVTVPNVENQLEEAAIDRLEGACDDPDPCFEVDITYEETGQVDEGRVIRQDPAGGQTAAPGSRVFIAVSTGPPEEEEDDDDDEDDDDEDDDEDDDGQGPEGEGPPGQSRLPGRWAALGRDTT